MGWVQALSQRSLGKGYWRDDGRVHWRYRMEAWDEGQ